MAVTTAVLLVGRYPLTGHRCSGFKQLPLFPFCNTSQEAMLHFLLYCTKLQAQREPYMMQLRTILPSKPEYIIEPSHFASTEEDILLLHYEGITRRMYIHSTIRDHPPWYRIDDGKGDTAMVQGINKTKKQTIIKIRNKMQKFKPNYQLDGSSRFCLREGIYTPSNK